MLKFSMQNINIYTCYYEPYQKEDSLKRKCYAYFIRARPVVDAD